ncbi:protein-ADP-ribose hydrolase [bacterium]|nr:protein-ADP-ribose hydrolase [bacterium]
MTLSLDDYRTLLALDAPYQAPAPASAQEAPELIKTLLSELIRAMPEDPLVRRLAQADQLSVRQRLQGMLTVLPARPAMPAAFHDQLDRLLQYELSQKAITQGATLPNLAERFVGTSFSAAARCALWRGDITTLEVDAIVNAANDAMMGCFQPFHACIDNAIHAAAGPRLREDCDRLMTLQGGPEPTGTAKVTRGYHLPSRFVLHTVGPLYRGPGPVPSARDREALAASYRSCLDLAAALGSIRTLAFCSISTGVFGFPARPAAEVALQTVARWLQDHPGVIDRVIFNVFSAADQELYESLLAV